MVLTIVALCAMALAAAILTATVLLQRVLTDRIDDKLLGAPKVIVELPRSQPPPDEEPVRRETTADLPYVYSYDAESRLVRAFGGREADPPALTGLGDLAERTGTTFTVEDEDGGDWRVLVQESPDGYLVMALSAEHVRAAAESLLLIGGGVTVAILALLAVVASRVVGIGLHPLDRMTSTAAAIAAGRLDERVADTDPHTETGRLGLALNTMLSRLQAALEDRAASEDRLRQFLADASHELRTPLTSVKGFAQLYRRGGAPPGPALDETVGRIEAEAGRMGLLLDDLMLLASLDRRRPFGSAPVDLLGVAADVIGDAHLREPGRFVALESLDGGEEPLEALEVTGDESRLRQVVTNLVSNALRHTPPEAEITVRLGWGAQSGPPCLAQVGEAPPRPAAVVEVADTGPGVDAEHAEAVFERLYRVDRGRPRAADGGGSGLGLSIVAAIVTGHGGCVRLAETPGGGATFRVLLPRANRLRPLSPPRSAAGSTRVSRPDRLV
ncbi:sensor histidine kinase [Glycomyces tenuis]|uniref:sensor histidine kinase n=1 Tax=Glycomyces tenuis TaxID=58116 RepID=UPI0009DBCEC2|nr:HAMP domain-containing sensor histidine kinase [Glycomyces tenuis]